MTTSSPKPWFGALAALGAAVVLAGCAAQPVEVRDNRELRQSIHGAVPESWRAAANSMDDINPLSVSPELSDFAAAVARKNRSGRDRMLSLVDAILKDDGVGLTYEPDATLTANEAFVAGVGNCLGFSHLLIAAARSVGLNANYELVSHRMRWDKVQDVFVGTLHVRVVSRVSGRRMVFDFYPLPVDSGYTAEILSDAEALAHHLNNLAAVSMHAGNNARAYSLLHRALGASPQTAFIWSNLGVLLSRHDLHSLAEAALRESLAISPDGRSAMSNLQRLYYKVGRNAEARELEAALDKHRRANPYYHAWLGELAQEQDRYQDAVEHFKRAIERNKKEPEFYAQLSEAYDSLGLSDAASRALKKSKELEKPLEERYRSRYPQPELGSHIPRD